MNLINFLFLNLTFSMVIMGLLVNVLDPYIPNFIKQSVRYGKHAHKGEQDQMVKKLEVPKSWFSHFYVFALLWSWGFFYQAVNIYLMGGAPSELMLKYLDFSCGDDRAEETSPLITLTALLLMSLQCTRRFVETNFLQIFSKTSKINLSHYFVGYLHYYGVILVIVSKATGFVRSSAATTINLSISEVFLSAITTALFLYAWYKQYESNMIFIKLRKNSAGKVTTEKHLLPSGGWFKYVTSPHMTAEVLMYIILGALLFQNTSYVWVIIWVASNQMNNAWLTHKWYMENFKNFPKQRKSLIPFLL